MKIQVGKKLVAFAHEGTVIVDSSVFNKLDSAGKTEAFTKFTGNVQFRDNFLTFTNKKSISDRLMRGEDVSSELAYHGIIYPTGFVQIREQYLLAAAPILEGLAPNPSAYPFAQTPNPAPIPTEYSDVRCTRGSYSIKTLTLKRIWDRVSPRWVKFWSEENQTAEKKKRWSSLKGEHHPGSTLDGGPSRYVSFFNNSIEIGCQTITRFELEQAALHFGWDIPVIQ